VDTSKEYIKMCEKAVEVQEEHILEMGEFYVNATQLLIRNGFDPRDICFEYMKSLGFQSGIVDFLWLPRQDQLQGMVEECCWTMIDDFNEWWEEVNVNSEEFCEKEKFYQSMEQLWLAFVMSELWNKTWNGEDWG